MRILAAALIAVLVFLHYLLWIDDDGVRQTHTLRITLRAQTEENAELAERNKGLEAEVKDLKSGLMAIEERARSDMGMIRPDETFYRLLDQPVPQYSTTPDKAAAPSGKSPPAAARKPPAAARKPPAAATKPPAPAEKPAVPAPPKPAAKPVAPPAKPKPAPTSAPPERHE